MTSVRAAIAGLMLAAVPLSTGNAAEAGGAGISAMPPTVEQMLPTMRRAMPGLEKALGLNKEQTDEFLRLTAQTGMRSSELAQQNIPAADRQAALMALSEATGHEADARFGAGTAARWRTYQQRRPAESFAQNIAPEFTRAGVPLDEVQQEKLATAYLELSRTSTTVSPSGQALVKQVGKALSSRQQKVLRTVIDLRLKAAPQRAAMAGLAFPYGMAAATSPATSGSPYSQVPSGAGGFVMSGPGPAAPAGPPPTGAQRQQLIDSYRNLLGDAASYMRLTTTQTQRLYDALADGGQAGYQSASQSASMPPQMIAMMGNRYTDVVRALVVKEFGESAAVRWDEYRPLRNGLTYVDNTLLKSFYSADVPLTGAQRLKLAASWQNGQLNAQRDASYASFGGGNSALTAISGAERSLATAENRNALVIKEARAYLDNAQVEVLFAQLDGSLENQRTQLRQQRAWSVQAPETAPRTVSGP